MREYICMAIYPLRRERVWVVMLDEVESEEGPGVVGSEVILTCRTQPLFIVGEVYEVDFTLKARAA